MASLLEERSLVAGHLGRPSRERELLACVEEAPEHRWDGQHIIYTRQIQRPFCSVHYNHHNLHLVPSNIV